MEIDSTVSTRQPSERHRTRLAISLGREHLSYALYDPLAPSDAERLRYTDIRLPRSPLAEFPDITTLEETVYAHPSILADYGRIDISVDCRDMLLTPAGTDSHLAESIADATMKADIDKILTDTADSLCDAAVWLRLPATLDAFLRRTFNTPRYHHPIAVMARCYSVDNTATPSPVVNLHFFDTHGLYIVIRHNNRLLLANRFDVRAATDVLYFTLGSINATGLTPSDVRVRTSGIANRRQEATTLLAESFDDVAPASLPAALLREGTAAISIPVELSSLLLL